MLTHWDMWKSTGGPLKTCFKIDLLCKPKFYYKICMLFIGNWFIRTLALENVMNWAFNFSRAFFVVSTYLLLTIFKLALCMTIYGAKYSKSATLASKSKRLGILQGVLPPRLVYLLRELLLKKFLTYKSPLNYFSSLCILSYLFVVFVLFCACVLVFSVNYYFICCD